MSNIELLLKDINILYPKSWEYISKFILKKYISSLKKDNFRNIIEKTPVSNINTLIDIKNGFQYYTKKIIKSIK